MYDEWDGMKKSNEKLNHRIRDSLREWVLPVMMLKALRTTLDVPTRSSFETLSSLIGVSILRSSSTETVLLQCSLETEPGMAARRVELKNARLRLEDVDANGSCSAMWDTASRDPDWYPIPTFLTFEVEVISSSYLDSIRRLAFGESNEHRPA